MKSLAGHRGSYLMVLVLLSKAPVEVDAAIVGLAPVKDNTLYEILDGSLSNGRGEHFFAGNTNGGSARRGLIAFDIAGNIPAGSTINGVSLTLYMSKSQAGGEVVTLRRVLADWGEGTSDAAGNEGVGAASTPGDASWLHRFFNTSFWTVAGGDFSDTATASTLVDQVGFYTWSSAEMAADVQSWLDMPSGNFGWLLLGNESATQTTKRFDTRENVVPANRPVLAVDFTPPPVGLSVAANQASFSSGENLTVSVDVDNTGVSRTADFYFGALLPDGDTIVFFTDLSFTVGVGSLSNVATLSPIAASVDLSAPFSFSQPSFFMYTWSGGEPSGTYVLFLAVVVPQSFTDGAVDPGDILALSTASLTFSP